uniref:Uncharacterized protein n=1 Tax=Arundo donax TaxID=35708 RepID=A0A0A8YDR2_ARUDO
MLMIRRHNVSEDVGFVRLVV